MLRNAIHIGDLVSSGGLVVTATSMLPHGGRMVASVGDMAHCEACDTQAPIIQLNEVATMMPNGRQIALEGDWVDCRCSPKPTVIALPGPVFEVEDNRPNPHDWSNEVLATPRSNSGGFDEHFKILDKVTKEPIKYADYAIERPDGTVEHGQTDEDGNTHILSQTVESEGLKVYVEGQE